MSPTPIPSAAPEATVAAAAGERPAGTPAPDGSSELARVIGLCRHNLLLWVTDLQVVILLLGLPLIMMAFLGPIYREALQGAGVVGATGAEQAVPGMAVMFTLFAAGILGTALHREREWNTWDRLRASGATSAQVLTGKVLPPLLVIAGQLLLLFTVGGAMFGLRVQGSLAGLVLVAAALAAAMLALGLAMASLVRSVTRLAAMGNAVSVTLAGLGGALTPLSVMPGWALVIAPATPSFWAMRGFQAAILEDGGLAMAATSAGVLLLFAAALGALAAWRFRHIEM